MKTILLVITGGIAAYKSLLLIRQLRAGGYRVLPVMTKSAHQFVTPLSVGAVAENEVRSALLDLTSAAKMGHLEFAREADLVGVAPATANFLAKMAHGLADDLASTLLLANRAPVLVAPAMNVAMWEAEATQENIKKLRARGVKFAGPVEGDMACGEFGYGRLIEPEEIFASIDSQFQNGPLKGKRVIITSGPTHEPIDPVRYIANRSSGKQGRAIARALHTQGAEVVFITGPASIPPPEGVQIVHVETAKEMQEAVKAALPADVFIGAAAVADWRVASASKDKIKKSKDGLPVLEFAENPDILAEISRGKQRPQLVIGFAAETQNIVEFAQAKRERKNCDWIFANDVSPQSGVMGGDRNRIHFIHAQGVSTWKQQSKTEVAYAIADEISKFFQNE